ncbi:MAG: GNAT family protein [Bacteroidales bacterium]|jgi:RimJ/RimL family protein N-acetyltransferase|nr:GNAT family N-acetyltransferase [Bacteroidales bacterium]MDD4213514.1 GNAT family protein [Bacteroidales bacterium]
MDFILRPWETSDLECVAHYANNANISKFMSDGFPCSIEKWKSFLEFATTDRTILFLAIEIDGQAVGGIGISPQKDIMKKNAELGYWLSENYWGRGIMTMAIKEIVQQAFEKLPDINRIYAKPFGTNHASHKTLEKAGFKLEARFEKTVLKNGELLDELIYAVRRK